MEEKSREAALLPLEPITSIPRTIEHAQNRAAMFAGPYFPIPPAPYSRGPPAGYAETSKVDYARACHTFVQSIAQSI
jgi:hypothetical protein